MEDIKTSSQRRNIYGIFWTLFGAGIVMIILGPIIDYIIVDFSLSQTQAGILSSVYAVGSIGGMMLSSLLWPAFPPNLVLGLSALGLSAFLMLFSFAEGYTMALTSFLMVGLVNGLIFSYATAFTGSSAAPGKKAAALNYLYGAFGFGVILGPFLAQLILNSTGNWRVVIYIPTAIMLISSFWMFATRRTSFSGKGPVSQAKGGLLLNGSILALLVSLCLYVSAEAAVNVWVVKFFTDIHGMADSGFILTLIWIAITLSRFLQARLLRTCGPREITIMAGLSTVALIGGAFIQNTICAIIFYFVAGIGLAGLYPSLMSQVSSIDTHNQSLLVSLATSAGALGGVLSPPIIGALAEHSGFSVAMGASAIFTLGVIIAVNLGYTHDNEP